MAEKIIVGEMECSGWKSPTSGRYRNPFTEIKAEQSVLLNRRMIHRAVLVVPIRYREATGYRDNPSFKMKVYDPKGKLLDTVEKNVEDEKGLFGSFDDVLVYELDRSYFREGTFPCQMVFKCKLEARLDIGRWDNYGERSSKFRVIKKTKTVKVQIRIWKECDLEISIGSYPFKKWWNKSYHIGALGTYTGKEKIHLSCSLKEVDLSAPGEVEAYPMVLLGDSRKRRDFLSTGESETYQSPPLIKDWNWRLPGPLGLKGPLKKAYNYTVVFHLSYPFADLPLVSVSEDIPITVVVPFLKRLRAKDAQNMWIATTAIALVSAVAWLVKPEVGAFLTVVAIGTGVTASYLDSEADDPIEYDKNYKKPHDFKKLQQKIKSDEAVPEIMRTFMESVYKVLALSKSINISYSRYMTAQLKHDKDAVKLQIESCETMLSQLEDEIITLDDNLYETLQVASEKQIAIDQPIVIEKLEKLKKKGLTESNKKFLIKEGLSAEIIAEAEAKIKEMKPEDVQLDPSPSIEKLYHNAMDCHIDALRQVKEIRRIHKLKGNDLLRELLNVGLLSYAEFQKRMNRLNYEFNYPLVEIEGIDSFYKAKLAAVGITTTQQLLERCAKRSQRISLAKRTGISGKLILEWANLADLMRIRGVSEEYSDMLEEVGVDTIVELSSRKPDNLYEKIKKYVKETRWVRRAPSKAQVKAWIEGARKLDRFLEY